MFKFSAHVIKIAACEPVFRMAGQVSNARRKIIEVGSSSNFIWNQFIITVFQQQGCRHSEIHLLVKLSPCLCLDITALCHQEIEKRLRRLLTGHSIFKKMSYLPSRLVLWPARNNIGRLVAYFGDDRFTSKATYPRFVDKLHFSFDPSVLKRQLCAISPRVLMTVCQLHCTCKT